jgi:hypothetical protein
MREREGSRSPYERFAALRLTQEALARRGYYLYTVERELTEGLITGPLVHRLQQDVKKRGLRKLGGRALITFSGYAHDPREVFAIPEVRAFWRELDRQVPELPALLAVLPELWFNGPALHLMLVGTVDAVRAQPARGGFDVHVADADAVIAAAVRRIRAAGSRYHLRQTAVSKMAEHFTRGARYRG